MRTTASGTMRRNGIMSLALLWLTGGPGVQSAMAFPGGTWAEATPESRGLDSNDPIGIRNGFFRGIGGALAKGGGASAEPAGLQDAPLATAPAPAARSHRFPPVADLPSQPGFPDPLRMLDGRRVATREQWFNERRPELEALFQHYMYGFLPPSPPTVTTRLEREDRGAFGGQATLKEIAVTFAPPPLPPVQLMLVIPNHRQGPAPVVLGMNYFGNHTLVRDPAVRLSTQWMPERGEGVVNNRATEASRGTWADIWRIEYLIERGYALATFYNGDIDPDHPDQRGIQTHFRPADPQDECGTIAAWAWGLSRAVDYLVTDTDLDAKRIAVTGHSRLGKAALLAAALDGRIALALPHQAGCGGSAPSRSTIRPRSAAGSPPLATPRKPPETVKQINDMFPHWFSARFKEFNDTPDRLPFDQHCLVALCAPRPVLFTNGRADTWINPEGQFEVLRAAAPVYRLLGAGDFDASQLPPDGETMGDTLGYFLRPGGHSLKPEDWKAFLDFADQHFGSASAARTAPPRAEVNSWLHAEPRSDDAPGGARLLRSPFKIETGAARREPRPAGNGSFDCENAPHPAFGHPLPSDRRGQGEGASGHFIGTSGSTGETQQRGGAAPEVPRWEMHEFELHGTCRAENPFRDASLRGDFSAPSGRTITVEGFHDGGDTWRLRFAPDEEGEWRYQLRGERIGGFFGKGDAFDVLSQQTGQRGEGVVWDEHLQCWVGDDPDLVASLRADRIFGKPVLNTESGYEYLRGHPTEKQQVHHTDKVRRSAWRLVCAGGYFAAGFHGTIGHSDIWNRIDAPNRYAFTVRDEGAANQLGILHDFFTALPFWQMQPFDGVTGDAAVALAHPGAAYVVFLPRGGKATVDLRAADGPMIARWFNPREGGFGETFNIAGGDRVDVDAPDVQDWALLVKRPMF